MHRLVHELLGVQCGQEAPSWDVGRQLQGVCVHPLGEHIRPPTYPVPHSLCAHGHQLAVSTDKVLCAGITG